MSPEAIAIMSFMVGDLSTMNYFYADSIGACYDVAIDHKGYDVPPEPKEDILKQVADTMHELGY